MSKMSNSLEEDIIRINDKVNTALWIAITSSILIVVHVAFSLVALVWR